MVDTKIVEEFALNMGCDFIETSAKTSVNVEKMFEKLSLDIRDNFIKDSLDSEKLYNKIYKPGEIEKNELTRYQKLRKECCN